MATGETKWSTKDRKVQGPKRTLLSPGEYDLRFNPGARIGCADRAGAVPYVTTMPTVLGQEGEPKLFLRFLLGLKPGKDGILNPERPGGILDLVDSNGLEAEFSILTQDGEDGNPVQMLNAQEVQETLNQMGEEGFVARANVKIEKGTPEYPEDKNTVRYFIKPLPSVKTKATATKGPIVKENKAEA